MDGRSALKIDDAIAFLCDFAQRTNAPSTAEGRGYYGYEIWLGKAVERYVAEIEGKERLPGGSRDPAPRERELAPVFFDAAWELCRRGILRPGLRELDGQGTGEGASGLGYSVTAYGRSWLTAERNGDLLPLQPGRLAELFEKLAGKLGRGFLDRAVEASQCYRSGNNLACCAMCGAAAESILLAVVIAKSRDESTTLSTYRSSQGRRKVTDAVVQGVTSANAVKFRDATGILAYWRDDAAHGQHSSISEIEAHEALSRLIRLAQFATDNWESFVGSEH